MARRARRRARRGDARAGARNPLRAFDNIDAKPPAVQEVLAAGADDRRVALRRLPRALRRGAPLPRRDGRRATSSSPTLVRGLDYYTRTTCEFVGLDGGSQADALRRRPLRRPDRGDRRPAHARRRLRRRDRAAADRAPRGTAGAGGAKGSTCSSSSTRAPTAPPCSRRWPSCAAAGVAADTDYAGRSLKGQLTQASRLGARATVVVGDGCDAAPHGAEDASLRSTALELAVSWRDLHARSSSAPSTSGETADARRLGGHAPRPRRARLRRPARPDRASASSCQPRARAEARRDRARSSATSSCSGRPARSSPARPRPSTRTCRPARSSSRSTTLEILSRSTPLPFQLDEENVDETLRLRYRWLDLRRDAACSATCASRTRSSSRSARTMDGRGLRRHRDADP